MKKDQDPDAIIVGDIHARDDQPPCRLDNFWETQIWKFKWLRNLWDEYGRPAVLQPGDLFYRWKSSPQVISAVMNYLPPMVTIPGNPGKHNYYSQEGFEKDALHVIQSSSLDWEVMASSDSMVIFGDRFSIHPGLWGVTDPNERSGVELIIPNVLLTHKMILDGPEMFEGENGNDFLKKHKGFDLIVTGHNHKPMEFGLDTRLLVNPGSFTRQTADETHRPRVYLWWAEDNSIMPVFVPTEEDVITREHIDQDKARDERIASFVESLADSALDVSIDFLKNIIGALESNKIREMVKQRVMEAVEDE